MTRKKEFPYWWKIKRVNDSFYLSGWNSNNPEWFFFFPWKYLALAMTVTVGGGGNKRQSRSCLHLASEDEWRAAPCCCFRMPLPMPKRSRSSHVHVLPLVPGGVSMGARCTSLSLLIMRAGTGRPTKGAY